MFIQVSLSWGLLTAEIDSVLGGLKKFSNRFKRPIKRNMKIRAARKPDIQNGLFLCSLMVFFGSQSDTD
jgi:hypothetical protein